MEISHLYFADDLMIFCRVKVASISFVVCSCVMLSLILNCSFLVLSAIGKGNCRLGILVFLLLLQSYLLMIV
jgi:hypothetical protein